MKLISCYIENFGGLVQHSLKFDEGLTVIQEPNGFGKTTLAEFLRAMFYGFPRKAKTLDKSRRQKYAPWGGGTCGGNLVFEHEGVRYRLERTFGATPRGDSFNLIDLETGRKSHRFSEEIGLELFQLDADSFERSTYLPQLHDGVTLTTTGIQAKLTRLVEDTNDLGNFDKAMAALKNKRSAFVPYRGSGGAVAEAAAQISRIQRELDRAVEQKTELEHCTARIGELETRIAEKKTQIAQTRQQWEQASKAAAERARYDDLNARYAAVVEELGLLDAKYPLGIPQETDLDEAWKTADQLTALEARQVTTQADLEALKILQEDAARFEDHIPEPGELEAVRQICEKHAALLAKRGSACLTESELLEYENLRRGFESGDLDEEKLDELAQQNSLLLRQRAVLDSLEISDQDRQRRNMLNDRFPRGVPEEAELDAQRQDLARCETLRRENLELEARAAAEPPKYNPVMLMTGAVIGVLGIVLLALRQFLPGGIVLAAGLVLAVLGMTGFGQQSGEKARLLARIAENRQQIADLEASLQEFTGGMTLDEIQRSREEALALKEKLRALKEKRAAQAELVRQTEEKLRSSLGSAADYDRAISNLRLALGQYRTLSEKKCALDGEMESLNRELEALGQELTAFFRRYYDRPERFTELLNALGRDAENYVRAKKQVSQWKQRKAAHEQELRQCEADLDGFFARFGLARSADVRRQLQQIWDDGKQQRSAAARERQFAAQLRQFPAVPEAGDPESLKQKEQRLNEMHRALTEDLLNLRQEQRLLQTCVDRIPELSDELERWQERKNTDQHKARLLDDTMDFLQKSRESLTTSYLGPIRESFDRYLTRLTGAKDQTFISSDLDVRLERQGQARELAYFSAGQTDTVMLCMRLALVDALFTDAKPFVILDDPFVNLDDERTAKALKLLKELSREQQIIYLTCSRSRTL